MRGLCYQLKEVCVDLFYLNVIFLSFLENEVIFVESNGSYKDLNNDCDDIKICFVKLVCVKQNYYVESFCCMNIQFFLCFWEMLLFKCFFNVLLGEDLGNSMIQLKYY